MTPDAGPENTRRLLAWQLSATSLVFLVAAGAFAIPMQLRAREVAREVRTERRAELDDATDRELAAAVDVSYRRLVLRRTRSRRVGTISAAGTIETRTEGHEADREAVEAAIVEAEAGVESATERLDRISSILGLQQLFIAPLRSCLDGVESANRALVAGDSAGAVAALGAASDACEQVRSGAIQPAFPYDFPDPHVVAGPSGRWWAYATNSTGGAVQSISSDDLVDWHVEGNALAGIPGWATRGATWAPAVVQNGGRWLLYYTVREQRSGLQCISVATSGSPAGPFHDTSTGPLVCERGEGGSIDPNPVRDTDGRLYLLWKTELDTLGGAAEIRGSLLDKTGTRLIGEKATLLRASQPWQRHTIEGPAMVISGGYHLLYSGGSWNRSGYSVGAARCWSILGPCVPEKGPALETVRNITGPGGLSVFRTAFGPAVVFHAWQGDAVGYPDNRYLHVGVLEIRNGTVTIRP